MIEKLINQNLNLNQDLYLGVIVIKMLVLLIAGACALIAGVDCGTFCKDENGKDVDFAIVYKIPKLGDQKEPLNTGFSYAYLTGKPISGSGKSSVSSWTLSDKLVTDPESLFGQTLKPMYSDPDKYTWFMYNDEPPHAHGKGSGSRAHAKGVVVMDGQTGFWLIHSIPRFANPPKDSKGKPVAYEYPASGANNGQTALCISFKTAKEAQDIATQVVNNRVNLYAMSLTPEVEKLAPKLIDLRDNKSPGTKIKNVETITSYKGVNFLSFARDKHSALEGDLYHRFVAPTLKTSMLVETWRNGAGGPLGPSCDGDHNVGNIAQVNLKFDGKKSKFPESGPWEYKKDHSKWAISDDSKTPVTCIGDINRMASQFKRGGGTVCINDKEVWDTVFKSIAGTEPCKAKSG